MAPRTPNSASTVSSMRAFCFSEASSTLAERTLGGDSMSSSGSSKAGASPRSSDFCRSRASRVEGLGGATWSAATWGPSSRAADRVSTSVTSKGRSSSPAACVSGEAWGSPGSSAGRGRGGLTLPAPPLVVGPLATRAALALGAGVPAGRGLGARRGRDWIQPKNSDTSRPRRLAPNARAGAAHRASRPAASSRVWGSLATAKPCDRPSSRASPNTPPSPRASGQSAGGCGAASTPATSSIARAPAMARTRSSPRFSRGSAAPARLKPQMIIIRAPTQAASPKVCRPMSARMAPRPPMALRGASPEATLKLGSAAR